MRACVSKDGRTHDVIYGDKRHLCAALRTAPRSGEPGTHNPESLGSITTRAMNSGLRPSPGGRNDALRIAERDVI